MLLPPVKNASGGADRAKVGEDVDSIHEKSFARIFFAEYRSMKTTESRR
jgi:hypothetical protein